MRPVCPPRVTGADGDQARHCRVRLHGVHDLSGKLSSRNPAFAIIHRAIQNRLAPRIPGVGLEGIRRQTLDLTRGNLFDDKMRVVYITHTWFGQGRVINVGGSDCLPKSPARMRFCGQRINRVVETVQHTFLHCDRIFFRLGDHARMNLHRLVARPIDDAGRAQRAAFVQGFLNSFPRFRRLEGLKLSGGDRPSLLLLVKEGDENHLDGSRGSVCPESRLRKRAGAAHRPRTLGQEFEIASRHCALQGMQLLRTAQERVVDCLRGASAHRCGGIVH